MASAGGWLGRCCCAFNCCSWQSPARESNLEEFYFRPDHPWDDCLRRHVVSTHIGAIRNSARSFLPSAVAEAHAWDIYREALAVQERKKWPTVGASIERRTFAYTTCVYNDEKIKAHVCIACAGVFPNTHSVRSEISIFDGAWLLSVSDSCLRENFSWDLFRQRYAAPGSPLHPQSVRNDDGMNADYSRWLLRLHSEHCSPPSFEKEPYLLCCPEDHTCQHGCHTQGLLCPHCRIPICMECATCLRNNQGIPKALANDNWWGYIQSWIFEQGVTWMEKTVSMPFWTGLTVFTLGRKDNERSNRKQHLMHAPMYSADRRVAFKGQLFSAPADWNGLLKQLEDFEKAEILRCTQPDEGPDLPVLGQVLAARVQIQLTSGIVNLKEHLKQATVRRHIVERLILLWRDAGHPDFKRVFMEKVHRRCALLADTDAPTIPKDVCEFLDLKGDGDGGEGVYEGVDKAATPAEPLRSEDDLQRDMGRSRPLLLFPQRDSDANKEVGPSRLNAWSQVNHLTVTTGSKLIDQFCSSYIPRVFSLSLPFCVGGPDFRGQARHRRTAAEAPVLDLDAFTAMMARRVEAQIKWDWDLLPGLWSVSFASKVNMSVSLGMRRSLRRCGADGMSNQKIGAATARIYKLLHEGEYIDSAGRRNCLTLLVPSPVFVGSSRRGGDVRMSRRRENTGTHNDYCVLRFEAMCRRWATSWA